MAFNGKLLELKVGNNWVEFPLKYIMPQTYKATPNQRMEKNTNRATTGLLVRQTLSHTATKIEFETTPIVNKDVKIIQDLLASAYTNAQERKLRAKYYDPSSDSYKEGDFYMPDVDYTIMRVEVTEQIIHYNPIRYALIEY